MGVMQMPNRFYIPDKTWNLDRKSNFDSFMGDYIEILKKKFEQVEVKGSNYTYSYYTCGQTRDPRNPSWRPFKLRRRKLETAFGVDFEGSGGKDFDLI